MATVQELLRAGSDLPGSSARRDTEILLCHCLEKSRAWLYTWPEKDVPVESEKHFERLLNARRDGQPVAYLIGSREFWSLQLAVNGATLIPRPETEILVAWALELNLPATSAVLDLGTGSGAIALAVASERPEWDVMAVDASEQALQVARDNANNNALQRVRFKQSDWYAAVSEMHFNLLLANPPYIDENDPHLQRGDVRFEPRSALVAPAAGTADLQHLVAAAPSHLYPGGWLLLEHGWEQAESVRAMLREAGFTQIETQLDLEQRERVTGGCWHAE